MENKKRLGVVLSLAYGKVLGCISTTEKAGVIEVAYNLSDNKLVNSFNARLSFSKKNLDSLYKDCSDYETLYHYNYDTDEMEM